MKKIIVQHGDLLLVEENIPETAKKIKTGNRYTALKGEGINTHDLVGQFEAYELDGTIYIKINDDKTSLVHSEHGTEILPKKTYRRMIEREWDYETEEMRNVQD